jgi:transposase-like protein
MATNDSPQTLTEAIRFYADPDVCQAKLVEARWPDGVECPTCGRKDVAYLANQKRWQCKGKHPRRQFSAKVGTIFEDSPVSLSDWFVAIWLIASAKNGISSYELHRTLGITQKSTWFMLHRIRLAMQSRSFLKIDGEIEIDETFVGGKARNMHLEKRRRVVEGPGVMSKIAVVGLLKRGAGNEHSTVRTQVIPNITKPVLQRIIDDQVQPMSRVFTDALKSYQGLDRKFTHEVIDHMVGYVRGTVHTNGLENFWSLLKRGLTGTYVSVEPWHLFRYVDEQAFRFNTRKMTDAQRFEAMTKRVLGKRLTYRELLGKPAPQAA